MRNQQIEEFIRSVLENMPTDWLTLTTHRLDIYNEKLAKTEFLDQVEKIYMGKEVSKQALSELRTAYDYIRLGHPLSSIVEWGIAKIYNLKPEAVISFSSLTAPVLAVLRKNYLLKKPTLIVFKNAIPVFFDSEIIQRIYGYPFELMQISEEEEIPKFEGSIILIEEKVRISEFSLNTRVDFYINFVGDIRLIFLDNFLFNNVF